MKKLLMAMLALVLMAGCSLRTVSTSANRETSAQASGIPDRTRRLPETISSPPTAGRVTRNLIVSSR